MSGTTPHALFTSNSVKEGRWGGLYVSVLELRKNHSTSGVWGFCLQWSPVLWVSEDIHEKLKHSSYFGVNFWRKIIAASITEHEKQRIAQ